MESIRDLLQPVLRPSDEGTAHLRFGIRPELTIDGERLQGGIVAAMLDMAMAIAAEGLISTASMHFEVLRPVTRSPLTVRAEVVRKGRRIVFVEAEMRDAEDALVASGRQTAIPLEPR